MSRPNAAYVGNFGLSHSVRLVIPSRLRGDAARLMTLSEACELISDLSAAIARAMEEQKKNPAPKGAT